MLNPLHHQQLASDPKNSVWVMASAGSGKTKVLTDRVLRILLSGVTPHKILCLTYTKVASIEMQKRIYQELQQWVICDDAQLAQKLINLGEDNINSQKIVRARSLLAKNLDAEFKIKIQTIHSFCQSILKSFPFEAKIPINFELLEENHGKILLKECQRKILQNSFADQNLRDLIIKLNSNIGDDTISDLISQLLNKKDKIIFLKTHYLSIDHIITQFYKKFNFENIPIAENLSAIFTNLIHHLDLSKLNSFSNQIRDINKTCAKTASDIDRFIASPVFENITILYQAFITNQDNPRKLKINDSLKTQFEHFIFHLQNFWQQYHLLKTLDNSATLLIIVDKILTEFHRAKIANGWVDYGDLINITNQMLANREFCDWIKLKMDNSFDHLLVDEAQDTNPIQWSIIQALIDDFFSGDSQSNNSRSVFVVGDEKQSIMGFQGSDINATKYFHDYLQIKSHQQLQDINLSVSFRSGIKILELVDAIFNHNIYQQAICKIGAYNPHISYKKTAGYVELWLNDELKQQINEANSSKSATNDDYSWNIDFTQTRDNNFKNILAKFVAHQIKDWHDNQKIISDKNRAVRYDDIMILMRNRESDFIERLTYYFTQLNIPYASVGKVKFSDNLLIQDFLALAKFALLKSDCFNLACLLKSPFFNVKEPELMEFCNYKNTHHLTLWEALRDSKYFNPLDNLIKLAQQQNCYEFYFRILYDPQNQQNILTRFGVNALEIINNFLLICQDFNSQNSPYLQKFLEFVEKIDPEISLNSNPKNQVRITTIHSSKGLQAPIVIIPDCQNQYSQQKDNRVNLLWDDDFPILINKESIINNEIKKLKEQKIHENYEEHLRLLYVALTRAEDELYIGGFSSRVDEKCWYEIIKSCAINCYQTRQINDVEIKPTDFASNPDKLKVADYNLTQSNYSYELVNQSLTHGEKIHKILEIIGKNNFMPRQWLINLSNNIIKNHLNSDLSLIDNASSMLTNFINSSLFTEIFNSPPATQIICEYQLTYQQQNLRIDLVKITQNDILIIDYKTDENTPDQIPSSYQRQINLYRDAIRNLYPNHHIKPAILWLKNLQLTFIN